MEPLSKSKFQSPAFLSFIREIQRHLQQTKKEQLCIETSKYHYNLPSDVKIYSLEEVSDKYNEFYEKKALLNQNFKWQIEEINIFVFLLLYYLEINGKMFDLMENEDWEFIGKLLFRSPNECEMKWNSLMKSRSNKKSWSLEEDQMLSKIIRTHLKKGGNISWVNISQELFEKSDRKIIKMARRCRERWINYLNPNLKKGSWSYEEDIKLLERFQQYNKKWSVISEVLKGRNLNSVKNRFHSLLKKNDISEPTSENINQLIVKLKNSDTSDSFIKDSSSELGKYDEDKEEVKLNEDPKKKLKLEEGQTEKNAKDFQNQFQIFNQFMVLANAFNDSKSNQQMPQQGYFPFNPFFAAAMMNKNPMDFPFLSPENIKKENQKTEEIENKNFN